MHSFMKDPFPFTNGQAGAFSQLVRHCSCMDPSGVHLLKASPPVIALISKKRLSAKQFNWLYLQSAGGYGAYKQTLESAFEFDFLISTCTCSWATICICNLLVSSQLFLAFLGPIWFSIVLLQYTTFVISISQYFEEIHTHTHTQSLEESRANAFAF